MTVKLPRVSKELSDKIDRWYEKDLRYKDALLSYYTIQNPHLLIPINRMPKEIKTYVTAVLSTTLRKLEKQLRLEDRKLPIVEKATIDDFQKKVMSCEQDHSVQLALRYVKENEDLCQSALSYSYKAKTSLCEHVQYIFIYTLAHLENQMRKDGLKQTRSN